MCLRTCVLYKVHNRQLTSLCKMPIDNHLSICYTIGTR
nr:MAG TPA: hypothetical protein [Caudoviricetes sp.]